MCIKITCLIKYIINAKNYVRKKYDDESRRRNEYSKLLQSDINRGRISPTLEDHEQDRVSPLQFVDIEENILKKKKRRKENTS